MRILAVAELGANWGHLLRLLPVIRALRARGHVVRLAAANVAAARGLLSDEPVEIVQCPGALVNARYKGVSQSRTVSTVIHAVEREGAAVG